MPLVHCMENELEKYEPESYEVKNFKKLLITQHQKRFGKIEQVERLTISTLLDPRFKKIHFKDFLSIGKAVVSIKKQLEDLYKKENRQDDTQPEIVQIIVEDNNEENDLDLWQHHKSLVTALQKSNYTSDEDIKNVINSEVSQYLNTPVHQLFGNPFKIWNTLKLMYPLLYKIAIKYLQVTATSVPAERLFSKTGQIMTDKRSRIKPKSLNRLVFLNSFDD
jgi:mRNA-degrading endonuclease HigB of HigAB toxin-antitoxin module